MKRYAKLKSKDVEQDQASKQDEESESAKEGEEQAEGNDFAKAVFNEVQGADVSTAESTLQVAESLASQGVEATTKADMGGDDDEKPDPDTMAFGGLLRLGSGGGTGEGDPEDAGDETKLERIENALRGQSSGGGPQGEAKGVMAPLMRNEETTGGLDLTKVMPLIQGSQGKPLPEVVANRMSKVLQHDFSHVMLHIDQKAIEACDAISANAFAYGSHIFMGQGRYLPGTPGGDLLLMEELTHVIQYDYKQLRSSSNGGLDVSNPGEAPEMEAKKAAYQGLQALKREESGEEDEAKTVVPQSAHPVSAGAKPEGQQMKVFMREAISDKGVAFRREMAADDLGGQDRSGRGGGQRSQPQPQSRPQPRSQAMPEKKLKQKEDPDGAGLGRRDYSGFSPSGGLTGGGLASVRPTPPAPAPETQSGSGWYNTEVDTYSAEQLAGVDGGSPKKREALVVGTPDINKTGGDMGGNGETVAAVKDVVSQKPSDMAKNWSAGADRISGGMQSEQQSIIDGVPSYSANLPGIADAKNVKEVPPKAEKPPATRELGFVKMGPAPRIPFMRRSGVFGRAESEGVNYLGQLPDDMEFDQGKPFYLRTVSNMPTRDPAAQPPPGGQKPAKINLSGDANPKEIKRHKAESVKTLDTAYARQKKFAQDVDPNISAPDLAIPESNIELAPPAKLEAFPPVPEMDHLNTLTHIDQPVIADFDADFGERLAPHGEQATADVQAANDEQKASNIEAITKHESELESHVLDAQVDREDALLTADQEVSAKQEETLAKQKIEADITRAKIDAEEAKTGAKADARLKADQKKIDSEYAKANAKADAEQKKADKKVEEEKKKSKKKKKKKGLFGKIGNFFKKALKALGKLVKKIAKAVAKFVSKVFEVVKKLANTIIKAVASFVKGLIKAFASIAKALITATIGRVFPKLAEELNKFIDYAVEKACEIVDKVADKLIEWIESALNTIEGVIQFAITLVEVATVLALEVYAAIISGEWGELIYYLFEAALRVVGLPLSEFERIFGADPAIKERIVNDTGGFFKDVGKGFSLGWDMFTDNIGENLIKGLVTWLAGPLGGAGITMPDKLDWKGILNLAMQIMGLDMESIKGVAIEVFGETTFAVFEALWAFRDGVTIDEVITLVAAFGAQQDADRIEEEDEEDQVNDKEGGVHGEEDKSVATQVAETAQSVKEMTDKVMPYIEAFQEGGIDEVIELLKAEMDGIVNEIVNMVVDKVVEMVIEKVIMKAVIQLAAMLIPGAGIVAAIYNAYKFIKALMDNLTSFQSLVVAICEGCAAAALGDPSKMGMLVNDALVNAIPLAINFLLGILGLGNLGAKIVEVIKGLQTFVHNALKKVFEFVKDIIGNVVDKVKEFVSNLFSKRDKDDEEEGNESGNDDISDLIREKLGETKGTVLPEHVVAAYAGGTAEQVGSLTREQMIAKGYETWHAAAGNDAAFVTAVAEDVGDTEAAALSARIAGETGLEDETPKTTFFQTLAQLIASWTDEGEVGDAAKEAANQPDYLKGGKKVSESDPAFDAMRAGPDLPTAWETLVTGGYQAAVSGEIQALIETPVTIPEEVSLAYWEVADGDLYSAPDISTGFNTSSTLESSSGGETWWAEAAPTTATGFEAAYPNIVDTGSVPATEGASGSHVQFSATPNLAGAEEMRLPTIFDALASDSMAERASDNAFGLGGGVPEFLAGVLPGTSVDAASLEVVRTGNGAAMAIVQEFLAANGATDEDTHFIDIEIGGSKSTVQVEKGWNDIEGGDLAQHDGVHVPGMRIKVDKDGQIKKTDDATVDIDADGGIIARGVKLAVEHDGARAILNKAVDKAETGLENLLPGVDVETEITADGVSATVTVGGGSFAGMTIEGGTLQLDYAGGQLTGSGSIGIKAGTEEGNIAGSLVVSWENGEWAFDGTATVTGLIPGLDAFTVGVKYADGSFVIEADGIDYTHDFGTITVGGQIDGLVWDQGAGSLSATATLEADLGAWGTGTAVATIAENKLEKLVITYASTEIAVPKTNPVFNGSLTGEIVYENGAFSGSLDGSAGIDMPQLLQGAGSGLSLDIDADVAADGTVTGTITSTEDISLGKYFVIKNGLTASLDAEGSVSSEFTVGVENTILDEASIDCVIDDSGFRVTGAAGSKSFGSEGDRAWGVVNAGYDQAAGFTLGGDVNVTLSDNMVANGVFEYSSKTDQVDSALSMADITILDMDKSASLFNMDKEFIIASFWGLVGLFADVGFSLDFNYNFDLSAQPTLTLEDLDLGDFSFASASADMKLMGGIGAALTATPNLGLGAYALHPSLLSAAGGINVPITAESKLNANGNVGVTYNPQGGISSGGTAQMGLTFSIDASIAPYANFKVMDGDIYEGNWEGGPLGQFELLPEKKLLDYEVDFSLIGSNQAEPEMPTTLEDGSGVQSDFTQSDVGNKQASATAEDEKSSTPDAATAEGGFDLPGMAAQMASSAGLGSLKDIMEAVGAAWGWLSDKMDVLMDFLSGWGQSISQGVDWVLNTIASKGFFGMVAEVLQANVSPTIYNIFEPLLDLGSASEAELMDMLSRPIPTTFDQWLDLLKDALGLAVSSISGLISAISTVVSRAASAAGELINELVQQGKIGVRRHHFYVGWYDFLAADEYKIQVFGANIVDPPDDFLLKPGNAVAFGLWELLESMGAVRPTNTAYHEECEERYNDYWK